MMIKSLNLALASIKNIFTNVQSQPTVSEITKFNNPKNISDDKFFVPKSTGQVVIKNVKIDSFLMKKSVGEISKIIATTPSKVSVKPEKQIILNKFSKVSETNLVGSTDNIKEDVNNYTAYELLTGISEIRPQVISLTEYKPLATLSGGSTTAKNYFDLQFFLRNLKFENFRSLVTTTVKDYNFNSLISDLVTTNKQAISELQKVSNNLLNVVFSIDVFQKSLDLRDEKKYTDIQYVIDKYVSNYTSNKSLAAFIQSSHPAKYSIYDVLASLGYNRDNINFYTNTKIWMQLVYELKSTVRDHSSTLLENRNIDPNLDKSPFAIVKNDVVKFALATKQPELIALNSLKDIKISDIKQTLSIIQSAYTNLYTPVKFVSDEHKIIAFLNWLSKEYRYSHALAQPVVVNTLKSKFNFTVKPSNNIDFCDFVFGTFGDSITQISPENNTTLVGFSAQASNNRALLTLENQYIVDGNTQLIPGAEQLVDSIFDVGQSRLLTTTNLQSFVATSEKYIENLSVIANQFDFLLNDPEPTNPKNINSIQQLSNPKILLDKIFSSIVDKSGKSLPTITDDVVASVFKHTQVNNTIKSLLFMYFITKVSRTASISIPFFSTGVSSDNTATIQVIVSLLMDELEKSLKNYHKDVNLSPDKIVTAVSIQNIHNLFITANSKLLKLVLDLFVLAITELQHENLVTDASNNSTRYSGHLDTAVMMTFFDFLLACINSSSKQEFLGRDSDISNGNRYLSFQHISTSKTTKHRVISLKSRINKEIVLTQQLSFTALNMLSSVKNSTQNLINKVSDSKVNESIQQINGILGRDRQLLQKFLDKQQILLFAKQTQDALVRVQDQKEENIAVIDENFMSVKEFLAVQKILSTNIFKDDGKNKRILSVGLPSGIVKKLHQSINVKSNRQKNLNNKQDDIINIVVYKIDNKNPNLVFKPQKFLFEMSRFVSRGNNNILNTAQNPVYNIPTVDISTGFLPEYINIADKRTAFQDNSYGFLSQTEKQQIYHNHVYSYVLEKYMSLMTGLSIHESTFSLKKSSYVVAPSVLAKLIDYELSVLTNKKITNGAGLVKYNVLFSSMPTTLSKDATPLVDNINTVLSQKDAGVISNVLELVDDVKTVGSTLSSKDTIQTKITTPKKFDRVFNILLDIDDFAIDREKTESSQIGKVVFSNLLNNQKLIQQSNGEYKLQRSKDEIIFDKYFVTIEVDDGVVK